VTGVRWQLHDQVGGTLVSLFVRDDLCAQLPKLNAILRRLPELQQAALRVVCEAHPRRARGERPAVGPGDRRRYCLTPEDAPSVSRPAMSGASSPVRPQGTSAIPSWAAVLSAARPVPLPTARRPAPAMPIDHRPRKEQRRESPAALPTGASPTPKTTKPVAPSPSPAPWEARIAALEARLNGIQTLCDNLRDVPRLLANIQHKLDLQASTPSPSLTSSSPPNPTVPASMAPSPVPPCDSSAPTVTVTAAVAELSKRASAHESLLERLCGQLNQLMQRMSQTEAVCSSTPMAWDMPSVDARNPADLPARPHTIRQ
jgi:uncharacterized coiled-coil protein SlyX